MENLGEVHEGGPEWLRALRWPTYREEALDLLERSGAPEDAMRFLRSLPAAVFTSEEAMRHVFALLYSGEYRNLIVQETPPSEDGDAS